MIEVWSGSQLASAAEMHALTISNEAKDRADNRGNPRASLRQPTREMFAVRSIIPRRRRAACRDWHFCQDTRALLRQIV